MKKYLGAIISGLVGILTFVFLSIENIVVKITVSGTTERDSLTAWELFNEENSASFESIGINSGFAKFTVIALAVVASLLIISAVVIVLKNVLKFKLKLNLNMINNILLSVYALVAILAIIAFFVLGSDIKSTMGSILESLVAMGGSYYFGPTTGAWINASVGVVACGAGWLFARKAK